MDTLTNLRVKSSSFFLFLDFCILAFFWYYYFFNFSAIRKKVDDEWEFRKICDEYSDFSTGRNVLHHAAEIGHFEICKFLINNVKVYTDALTYKSSLFLASS